MEGSQSCFGSQNMISLTEYRAMTPEQRKQVVKGQKTPVIPSDFGIKTCYPQYVAAVFMNRTFPHYPKMEGGTAIILNEGDIHDGELHYRGHVDSVTMSWKGYITQLFQNKMKFCPVNEFSVIQGECNNVHFEFHGSVLWCGVWPAFLEMYK